MKILIIAATPPPNHGQAFMTQLLIEDLQQQKNNTQPFNVRHLNSVISTELNELGRFSPKKILRLSFLFLKALLITVFWKPDTIYYVPANNLRSQVWRDWLLFGIPRRFVQRCVLHWHGLGLKALYEKQLAPWEKSLTWWALGSVNCSIIMTEYQRRHVDWLKPDEILIIPNGIPDPCPDFRNNTLPQRRKRLKKRCLALSEKSNTFQTLKDHQSVLSETDFKHRGANQRIERIPEILIFRCLFLAHCTEKKGLFDAIDAVAKVNSELKIQNSPVRVTLEICGQFVSNEERRRFDKRISQSDLEIPNYNFPSDQCDASSQSGFECESNIIKNSKSSTCAVYYCGFISGKKKQQLMLQCDCLLFPTHWENCPLSVLEAFAWGLPVCVYDTMGLPEICPTNYPGLARSSDINSLAKGILWTMSTNSFEDIRKHYLERYRLELNLSRTYNSISSFSKQSTH